MADTLRILVVDDEPGMRSGIERALKSFTVRAKDVNGEVGFVVEHAESGEQALDKLLPNHDGGDGQAPFDILLLDHMLPGISGLEVLDKISGKYDGIVTIMITAYASLKTAVSAIKQGAYDFLPKPFTPHELKNTVRKAAESLILARQARRLAAEKKQVRFQFIRVLAHELKAPLAAIEGYLHILRDRSAGDEQAVYDHMLDRGLIRLEGMRKLISDLLDLTRIESGQMKRELVEVDLRQAAAAAIELLSAEARRHNVKVELVAGQPVTLKADRSEMEIIFNNLLSNAIKYNRPGGKVTVELTKDGGPAVISVADTGIGMSPQDAARLFEDFVRIKTDKTRDILGSGLGLSIVKKLSTLYGGDVTVTSAPDVGSTFKVTLAEGGGEA